MDRRIRTLTVAVLATVAAACGRHGEKVSLPATPAAGRAVRVTKPSARIETGLARATGAVRAREDAVLSARATGQIKRIRVQVGDRVKVGAVLAEMDSVNAAIALQNAKAMERLAAARFAEAEREAVRAKEVYDGQAMPKAAYDQAQTGREVAAAQLDQAKVAVRQAEQAVQDATITAPFAGVVTAKFRNAGDTVTLMPVSPIVALTDVDHLELRLTVPEALEPAIEVGQVVEGQTTPGGRAFQAKVRVKSPVVDPATRTVEVLADVVSDGLRPGRDRHRRLRPVRRGRGAVRPVHRGAHRREGELGPRRRERQGGAARRRRPPGPPRDDRRAAGARPRRRRHRGPGRARAGGGRLRPRRLTDAERSREPHPHLHHPPGLHRDAHPRRAGLRPRRLPEASASTSSRRSSSRSSP